MKNLKKIKLIHDCLKKEKDRLIIDLFNINANIHRMDESVKKILSYHSEYSKSNLLQLSKETPLLHKNLNAFSNRLLEIVQKEEIEIAKVEQYKREKLKQIEVIEKKMSVMNHFSDAINASNFSKMENAEQVMLDDLSSVKIRRSDHE